MTRRSLPIVLLSLLLPAAAVGLKAWNAAPLLAMPALQQASSAFAAADRPMTCGNAPRDHSRMLRWVGSPEAPPPPPHEGPCLWPAGLWVPSPVEARSRRGADHPAEAKAAIAELERLHLRDAVAPSGRWLCTRAIALETLRHQGEPPAGRFRGLWPSSTVFERWALTRGELPAALSGAAPLGEAPRGAAPSDAEPPAELVATLEGLILANPIGFCSVGLPEQLRRLKAADAEAVQKAQFSLEAYAFVVDDAIAGGAGRFPPAPFLSEDQFVPLPGAPGFEVDLEEKGFGDFTLNARRAGEIVNVATVEHQAGPHAYRAMYRRGLRDGTLSDAAAVRVGPLRKPWPTVVTTRAYARWGRDAEADAIEREVAREQRAGTLRLPQPLALHAPGMLELPRYAADQSKRDDLIALLRFAAAFDARMLFDRNFQVRDWGRASFLAPVPQDARRSVQFTRVGEGRGTLELLHDAALTGAVFDYTASPAARRAAGHR